MPVLLKLHEDEANDIAGAAQAAEVFRERARATDVLQLQFHRISVDPEIRLGTEPRHPWFRFDIAWPRGVGADAHSWQHVFTVTLPTILERRRVMAGDWGTQVAERRWREVSQLDLRPIG